TFKLIPKRRPIFFFALTLYLLSFVPYILDKFSTGTGYLESRYYYISAFAFGLLLFIYLEFLLSKRSKYIQLLIMAIPAVLILFNAVLIRQEITLRNELTNKRKEILEYSKSEFINELDSSFIIYIQDSNIPNPLINNVTGMYFQTGFLYPFLVYVYGTGQVPASVFADDFFWDSSFQGVGKT